jgi:hypothetical protein
MTPRLAAALVLLNVVAFGSAEGQGSDSTGYKKRPEVRFGALAMRLARAVAAPGSPVTTADANLAGVEFVAKDDDGAGVHLRYAAAEIAGPATSVSAGKLEYVDGKLIIGSKAFAVTAGYRLRTFRYPQVDRRMHFAHAGAQAGYRFHGAGIELNVAGSYFRSVKKDAVDSLQVSGWEGESSIMYTVPRLPLYVGLGYRRELFDLRRDTAFPRREELGGLLLTVGVQAGLGTR